MSNNFATAAGVGLIALVAGLGIGHYGTLQEGLKTSQDVSAQLASLEIDSANVPIAGSPVRGGANALATIVVFSDLRTPGMKAFNDGMLNNAFKLHGDKVAVVYKAYPLQDNPDSMMRAQAVAAAHLQKKAWAMYDKVLAFGSERVMGEADAVALAKSLNLDVAKFQADLNSREVRDAVRKDIELGKKLNISGAPAVFINSRPVVAGSELTEKKFNDDLNAEIARMSALSTKGNVNYYVGSMLNQELVAAAGSFDALGRPIRGSRDAVVTIVEYSDYECPYCGRVEPTLAKILEEYKGDVRIVFSHHPLSFHKNAKLAHQAAYAAGLQNKFWEMHDTLFKNQKKLTEPDLLGYARKLGLDMNRFAADMKDPKTVEAIDKMIADAGKQGISGTPNFQINGLPISGAQPYEKFKETIDKVLVIAKKVSADTGLRGDALHAELLKNLPKKPPTPRQAPPADEGKIFVDISGAPVYGDVNAPVTIVEFTDFQCPYCSRGSNTIKELIEKNPGKVKLVFKSNPLSFHKDAEPAHRAAEAASLQGKFWEMYQLLFDNQKVLSQDNFDKYALQLGLDMDKFHADMASEAVKKRVQDDLKQGMSVGVRGTPHFFMNGTRMSGAQPLEKFQEALDRELAIAKKYQDKGIAADALYKTIITEENKNKPKPAAAPAPAPEAPAAPIVLNQGSSYAKGPADAPVVIYKFSEFECPFCGRVEPTLEELMKTYNGKIRIVFKNNPLPFHKNAKLASEAALAAGEQGKFWEMHDILFKNQKALERDQLIEHAKTIPGLDIAKFTQALDSHKFAAQVESELAEGSKAGITGTPTFVINGKKLVGAQPIDKFKAEIDAALAAKK
ncbi:MAG: thioredoxin domain-containing protein [Proteobacteria bacterium]|nr:thioredoxin domain-containing protein [Pseudomonadota bacterium]